MPIRNHGAAWLLTILILPVPAWADITDATAFLIGSQTLNLDTGTITTAGGDVQWDGQHLNFKGTATGYAIPNQSFAPGNFDQISQEQLATFDAKGLYSASPITINISRSYITAVHTNGGNYAKILVLTLSAQALFKYTTFGGLPGPCAGPNEASITEFQNNYSFIAPALPNYGIAPGSLFVVEGASLNGQPLSSLQSSAPPGLPTTFRGTSLSVTVNGTITTPPIYYTSPTQIGAVLPSTTAPGTGTLTVYREGVSCATHQIVVVPSALGLDVATDAGGDYFSTLTSAKPGQTIVLWGSGVGADTTNDDRTYPMNQNNLTNIPVTVYIGGVPVTPLYQGRSPYPGVDQVNVVIPPTVSTGCAVSVIAMSGGIVSNSITVPITQDGGPCSDMVSGMNPAVLQLLTSNSNVNIGSLVVSEVFDQHLGDSALVEATFFKIPSSPFLTSPNPFWLVPNGNLASVGSCIFVTPALLSVNQLQPGTVALTVAGAQGPESGIQTADGISYTVPLSAFPSTGAAFQFTATDGKDVGAFDAIVNFPPAVTWTNQNSISPIDRTQGQAVTWTGGTVGTYVQLRGASGGVTFSCFAPASAGQFTIPFWILSALPPGSGSLSLVFATTPQPFSAQGLDYAYGYAASTIDLPVTYQ